MLEKGLDQKLKTGLLGSARGKFESSLSFLALFVVVGIFAIITGGRAIAVSNIEIIAQQSCIFLVAAMGVTFTISQGNMDMGLGGTMVLACMTAGIVGETAPALVLPVCILVGIACEMIICVLHILFNMPTVTASFIIMFLGKGIASTIMLTRNTNVTFPKALNFLDNPVFFFGLTILVIVVSYILSQYTKIGKFNRAIGSNESAARFSGVPVNKYKSLGFLYSGITMGIAAFMMLIRSGGVTAKTGIGFEVNIIVLLTLGGISLTGGTNVRVIKAIAGCLLLVFLNNALIMVGINSTEVGLIKGVIFLIAVAIGFDRKSMTYIV